MNVIDSLVVLLGLDSSGMKKGADEAQQAQDKIKADADKSAKAIAASEKKRDADTSASLKKRTSEESAARKKAAADEAKQAKEREQASKKASDALGKVRNEVLGLMTAYFGLNAIVGAGKQVIGEGIHNALKTGALGVGAKDLAAWKGAAREFGASGEEIEATFGKINALQTGLQTGDVGALSTFQGYAQTLAAKSGGKVKADTSVLMDRNATQQQVLLELAKETAQLSEKDAVQALAKLGIAENTALALHSGDIALAQSLDKYGKMHPAAKALTEESRKLNKSWTDFSETVSGVKESIMAAVAPAIDWVLGKLQKLADWAKDHIPATIAIIGGISAALLGISGITFAGVIGQLGALTGGLGKVGTAAQAAIKLLGNGGLVLAAGAAGYAIGSALYDGLISGTKFADTLGRWETELMAFLGNAEAKADLARMKALDDSQRKSGGKVGGAPPKPAAASAAAPPEIVAAAQAAEVKYGVPASVTIAQWKLESNSGKSMPAGSNNPFGIKAKPGQPYVEAETTEFANGQMQKVKQRFAKFDSIADAFDAHAKLLATGAAYSEARKHTADPAAYADALTGKYATDPQYGQKLKALMAQDVPAAPSPIDPALSTGAHAAVASNQTINNTRTASNSHVETNINGPININAPNARTNGDVASAIGERMQTYSFASLANVGLA